MPVLGHSGIEVSAVCLGGNTFGWTADREMSFRVLDAYVERRGNFIDSADVYSAWVPGNLGGESESIIGDWVQARGNRESVVVATKVSQHAEYRGLSAANIAAAARASLRRLRTNYIDLYYAHYDDPNTPLEETVRAFDDLLNAGLVRSVGISNYSPERAGQWVETATSIGASLPSVLQPHYNLMARNPYESQLLPLVQKYELAVVPHSGLAGGFLTGKYKPGEVATGARAGSVEGYLSDRGFAIVREVESVASEIGAAPASVALAWLKGRPGVVSPAASASTPEQVGTLLAAAELALSTEQVSRLDAVSAAFEN